MEDGKTDEGDKGGEEDNTGTENNSELDKLKAHNDAVEKELVRGRELKSEAQKLEAEKMVGGKSDAGSVQEPKKEETNHEYHERIKKEMAAGKTDFKDGN